jgi:hypothetical protein
MFNPLGFCSKNFCCKIGHLVQKMSLDPCDRGAFHSTYNHSEGLLMRSIGRVELAVYGTALWLAMLSGSAFADTVPLDDPLHGYCAVGCIDNGTNSPTSQNPPVNFGFTVSPGPASGSQYMIDILTPNNVAAGPSFTLTGPSGTATLVPGIPPGPWTAGFLDAYLGISASPANPIGAYLPSTQALDPGATGFNVYAANLGPITLQGTANPNVSPLENIASGILPAGSYIVAFLNEGTAAAPNWIATANSGAIFVTGAPVPGPIVGAGLPGLIAACGGLLALARRRRHRTI